MNVGHGGQGDDEEKNLHVSLIPEDKFLPYHSDPCARRPVCVCVCVHRVRVHTHTQGIHIYLHTKTHSHIHTKRTGISAQATAHMHNIHTKHQKKKQNFHDLLRPGGVVNIGVRDYDFFINNHAKLYPRQVRVCACICIYCTLNMYVCIFT